MDQGIPTDLRAAWVLRVLGVRIPSAAPDVALSAVPDADEVHDRITTLGLQLRNNSVLLGHSDLTSALTRAVALFKAHDLAGAAQQLDVLEAGIVGLSASTRAAGEMGQGVSLRAAATAALTWRDQCRAAGQQVSAMKDAFITALRAEKVLDEDEIAQIAEGLDQFDVITSSMNETIADMLDTLIETKAEDRAAQVARIREAVDEQEDMLNTSEAVQAIGGNGIMELDIAGPALAALSRIRNALPS